MLDKSTYELELPMQSGIEGQDGTPLPTVMLSYRIRNRGSTPAGVL